MTTSSVSEIEHNIYSSRSVDHLCNIGSTPSGSEPNLDTSHILFHKQTMAYLRSLSEEDGPDLYPSDFDVEED
jgi:hypothetical protein